MKPMNYWKKAAVALMLAGFGSFGFSYQPASAMQHPVTIEDQGSFMAGGKTVTAPGTYDGTKPTDFAGETLHGDHAYVFFSVVSLPDIGIKGSTHFMMADLNNREVADAMVKWVHERKLDR